MTDLKIKELDTKYGRIFSRNALIIRDYSIQITPMTVNIKTSLSLRGCIPSVKDAPDVCVEFYFSDVESVSIYKVDDFPYEKYTLSSFDEVEGEYKKNRKRVILSTYDHVFDIIGNIELKYD
ncbi:hypothetical protein [Pectobacterium brasiliense]|uniref:hypothetical protein n=1 Tax=Pectobacterium brasiliense TaxID=180957 RepID=UPI000582973F|nr:hypothetical protein [Pectobacterium brasiliense]KHT01163.1 hypothetical protein RC92_21140 [Pectobacterium brasiliense]KHT02860.1 hypothetical protein RC94_20740 [Pectobacterium brasiliense]MDY4382327.1 hypothetical protein [Pectobacterium brasiliense]